MKIHIIEIGTGLESHAVRYAAEYFGAMTTVTWVGNSGQVVEFFASEPDHELIIVSGHGDERGLLMPELGAEVKHKYPYDEVIRPEDFDTFLKLKSNVVINASCEGGLPALASVFLKNGASYYIAPVGAPHGNDSLMYLLSFLYQYLHYELDVEDAHYVSSNFPDDRSMFKLFK